MIELKFSLELTKGGVQKAIFAKSGERGSRVVLITLTEAGKVFDASPYRLRVNFDSGESVGSKVTFEQGCVRFEIPEGALVTPGEKLCELQISNDTRLIYAPVFKILIEQSIGQQNTEDIPFGESIHYQESIPNLNVGKNVTLNDEVALFDGEDTTRNKLSALPFVTEETYDKHIQEQAEVNKIVGANAIAKHTHDNKELLDKLSYNGELLVDGKPVAPALPDIDNKVAQILSKTPVSTFENDMQYVEQYQLDNFEGERIAPLWDAVGVLDDERHTHLNKTLLDAFSFGAGGELLFNGKPISSGGGSANPDGGVADPTLTMLQTVALLFESSNTMVLWESPETPINFRTYMWELQEQRRRLLYIPLQSGTINYTDPLSYTDVFVPVSLYSLYEFYPNPNAESESGFGKVEFNKYAGETVLEFLKDYILADAGGGGGVVVETDPTVPDWAKEPEPPKYNASEIAYTNAIFGGEVDNVKSGLDQAISYVTTELPRIEKKIDDKTVPAKEEIVADVLNALPTWNGGAY